MVDTVSIGVFAYNEVERIPLLLDSLLQQELSSNYVLKEILVVASGCTDGTDRVVEKRARIDPRLSLIREPQRRGKSFAINTLLRHYRGDVLIFVNADARLLPGALSALLNAFHRDNRIELACGLASPDPSPNPVLNVIEEVWWRLHNSTLETLSDMDEGNHCCDELMAMRRGFAESIPSEVINDGAYLGVLGALRGTTVRFCPDAAVVVEIPTSLVGLVRQRRRILTGHRQVYAILGRSPLTLEGLARLRPAIAARIVVKELSYNPLRTFAFLAFALPLELLSHVLVFLDQARGASFQPAWPMVE